MQKVLSTRSWCTTCQHAFLSKAENSKSFQHCLSKAKVSQTLGLYMQMDSESTSAPTSDSFPFLSYVSLKAQAVVSESAGQWRLNLRPLFLFQKVSFGNWAKCQWPLATCFPFLSFLPVLNFVAVFVGFCLTVSVSLINSLFTTKCM